MTPVQKRHYSFACWRHSVHTIPQHSHLRQKILFKDLSNKQLRSLAPDIIMIHIEQHIVEHR